MNKAELKQIEKLKREYLKHKQIADEIFNRSKYEYEALDVCEKRKGDQAYGYAQGIYQALSILGQAAELPIMS
ncbi:MAG: hypothetical protein J6K17_04000 [Oscillospiraceae bacterium]|nr:hypothetical protein [Oscillospiraceae bacterium]